LFIGFVDCADGIDTMPAEVVRGMLEVVFRASQRTKRSFDLRMLPGGWGRRRKRDHETQNYGCKHHSISHRFFSPFLPSTTRLAISYPTLMPAHKLFLGFRNRVKYKASQGFCPSSRSMADPKTAEFSRRTRDTFRSRLALDGDASVVPSAFPLSPGRHHWNPGCARPLAPVQAAPNI
jgi:hypothetical protein